MEELHGKLKILLDAYMAYATASKNEDDVKEAIKKVGQLFAPGVSQLRATADQLPNEQPEKRTRKRRARHMQSPRGLATAITAVLRKYPDGRSEEDIHNELLDTGTIARNITLEMVVYTLNKNTGVYTKKLNGLWVLRASNPRSPKPRKQNGKTVTTEPDVPQ